MSPDYLEALADLADPEKLWQRPGLEHLGFSDEQRQQLDAGVALRRYASHCRRLLALIAEKRSLLITPITENSTAITSVATPAKHRKLRAALATPPATPDEAAK